MFLLFVVGVVTLLATSPAAAGPADEEHGVGEVVAVSATGNASCSGEACVAASGTGNASGTHAASGTGEARSCTEFANCVAASGTGNATGHIAATATGAARSCTQYVSCVAASGTENATGRNPVSVAGKCRDEADEEPHPCVALEDEGDARGEHLAVSATGEASCSTDECAAASGSGDAACRGEDCRSVSVLGNASCQGVRCGATSGTGNAACEGFACRGASSTGDVSCKGSDCVAATATGSARCAAPHFQLLIDDPCFAVSGTGDADREEGGGYAVGVTGDCYGRTCFAVEPTGPARGTWLGVSATGPAQGIVAVSLLDNASGWVAVSGTGDAHCIYPCVATVSGTGEADDWTAYSFSGCETGRRLGTDTLCRDEPAAPTALLP